MYDKCQFPFSYAGIGPHWKACICTPPLRTTLMMIHGREGHTRYKPSTIPHPSITLPSIPHALSLPLPISPLPPIPQSVGLVHQLELVGHSPKATIPLFGSHATHPIPYSSIVAQPNNLSNAANTPHPPPTHLPHPSPTQE